MRGVTGPVPGPNARRPVLFLMADTGGGHRAAAEAVAGALKRRYPGAFDPVLCDPVGGPRAARLLRWLTGLYGPTIRWVPPLWGAVFYATNTRITAALLRSTLLLLANRPVTEVVERLRPAAIVSLHPLTVRAAVAARDHAGPDIPVMTVVTDLINPHVTWLDDGVDRVVVPSTAADWPRCPGHLKADRRIEASPPVAACFAAGPLRLSERRELRRSLGLDEDRFVVVLAGGAEGSGGIARRAVGILRRTDDVSVVALCGRSTRLERKLSSLAARSGGRLIVKGFVDNMAEVDAARAADPSRPILMNGFLPTSIPVGLQQGWRTRDQGDSLVVAQQLADIVGIDFYPRHALAALGARAVYLAGSRSPWQQRRRRALFRWAAAPGRQVMVSEGQAEPWETVTDPPNPVNQGMASCLPEHLIENYNQCMSWSKDAPAHLSAYLFWGAEYWLLRHRDGDPRYLRAFARVLEQS